MPNAEVQADKAWLTTDDNPFNPFTQWNEWYEYDEDHHYCTTEYIARMAMLSDSMTDEEESQVRYVFPISNRLRQVNDISLKI